MTIRAKKFTPQVLLSAPRRSAAVPNAAGTLALFTVSTYSFQTHEKTSEIRLLDIETGHTSLLSNDVQASEPTWLGDGNLVLWLKGAPKGKTVLTVADAYKLDNSPQAIAWFDGAVSNVKTKSIGVNTFALAVTGLATPDGDLFNSVTAKKPHSSAKLYSSLFVRHWDTYVTENKNTIWYTTVRKIERTKELVVDPLKNALYGHPFSLESPVPPFGGAGDFDISKSGITFVARDPKIDPATHTKTDLYFIPLKTFLEAKAPTPVLVKTGNLKGYSTGPVFSPDAKSVAFTRMRSVQYESDKPRLLIVPDITDPANVQEFYDTKDGEGKWDLRPESITWSQNGEELYVTAEENGRGKLFKLPASPRHAKDLPTALIEDGTVTDAHLLPSGMLLVSSNSFVDNSVYSLLNPQKPSEIAALSSNSKAGKSFGLSQIQIDEFWYAGAEDYNVHAWIVKPSNFDKTKKYPLAYMIHGGPQSAWNEGWSTRWNPAVFAEQGYVVITPNPTGSTGYGMAFQNGIREQWGGRPYLDLVKGFEYIESNLTYVDTTRAVALGASYGGYMMNWIQGQPLGRKFKALVTHDGVFSTLNQYASEELFFPIHDFGGTLWENRKGYEKWDPAKYVENWATPHLIIHNELDYRLPISEGLATFNALQTKGVPSKLLIFPDENHWVLKPENSLVWHREVLDWINKFSGIADKEQEDVGSRISGIKL